MPSLIPQSQLTVVTDSRPYADRRVDKTVKTHRRTVQGARTGGAGTTSMNIDASDDTDTTEHVRVTARQLITATLTDHH